MPIEAYPGKSPIPKVPANIMLIAVTNDIILQNLSPICPNIRAPSGLNKKPIASAAKEANREAIGSWMERKQMQLLLHKQRMYKNPAILRKHRPKILKQLMINLQT